MTFLIIEITRIGNEQAVNIVSLKLGHYYVCTGGQLRLHNVFTSHQACKQAAQKLQHDLHAMQGNLDKLLLPDLGAYHFVWAHGPTDSSSSFDVQCTSHGVEHETSPDEEFVITFAGTDLEQALEFMSNYGASEGFDSQDIPVLMLSVEVGEA